MTQIWTGEVQTTTTPKVLEQAGMSHEMASIMGSVISMAASPLAGGTKLITNAPKIASNVTKIARQVATNYTKNNYRKNLIKYTGINPGTKVDAHHVFPQKFRPDFYEKGINIDDPKYLTWWERSSHQRNAKDYNIRWGEFLDSAPKRDEIFEFGKKIMSDYEMPINY